MRMSATSQDSEPIRLFNEDNNVNSINVDNAGTALYTIFCRVLECCIR